MIIRLLLDLLYSLESIGGTAVGTIIVISNLLVRYVIGSPILREELDFLRLLYNRSVFIDDSW